MVRRQCDHRRGRHGPELCGRPRRLLTDGGSGNDGDGADRADEESSEDSTRVRDPGTAEPDEETWDPPDIDDIPEFEVRAETPVTADTEQPDSDTVDVSASEGGPPDGPTDPTAGMPNDAQAPGATAVTSQETEAYIAALEICTRLPEEVRLPEEAADLVPAAVEAELEQDIQSFAAAEFDNARPHVDVLSFDEVDEDIWLRIRIGLPAEAFRELEPDALRSYALQRLEGVF